MILKMYAIYDSKALAFLPPFFMHNDSVAKRIFQDTVLDPASQFHKHPEDYTLFCVGTFEDSTAKIEPLAQALNLGLAMMPDTAYSVPIERVKPGIRTEA